MQEIVMRGFTEKVGDADEIFVAFIGYPNGMPGVTIIHILNDQEYGGKVHFVIPLPKLVQIDQSQQIGQDRLLLAGIEQFSKSQWPAEVVRSPDSLFQDQLIL